MTPTERRLLPHHVVKTFLFERLLLVASTALALAAVLTGRVSIPEIPGLMDTRLLSLFFVLTIAVELGKDSDLFDRLVDAVARRAGSAAALKRAVKTISFLMKISCSAAPPVATIGQTAYVRHPIRR